MNVFVLGFLLSMVTAPEFVVFVMFETVSASYVSAIFTILVISLGGTLGSTAIYLGARMVGARRCKELIKRHGKKILLKTSDLDDIDYYYERWGGPIVFFGRWLPTFRSLVSIPAGLSRMSAWRFITLTFSGTLAWNTMLCLMVLGLRSYLDYLELGLEGYTWLTVAALLLLGAYLAVRRISERMVRDVQEKEDRNS
ncbi:DedA family protein [Desulfonatronovibrio hydrogenovorans]|uniref:DedA family protein n=1 Tax=Desulfonatronovibrio hydrogenovorans TaxID=53245 RepID=UPI00068F83C8|nr:DedA family protein [Desulfonatronovibrio hydrogenovorans]